MLDLPKDMRVDFASRAEQLAHYGAIHKRLHCGVVPKPIQKISVESEPIPEPAPAPIVEIPVHVVTEPEVAPPVTLAPVPIVSKYPKVHDIQRLVARHYDVSMLDMTSSRRQQNICRPRQVAMYLARLLTPYGYMRIGFYFGGRDHTTVLSAVRKVAELMLTDPELAATVAMLQQVLVAMLEPAAA